MRAALRCPDPPGPGCDCAPMRKSNIKKVDPLVCLNGLIGHYICSPRVSVCQVVDLVICRHAIKVIQLWFRLKTSTSPQFHTTGEVPKGYKEKMEVKACIHSRKLFL
ncbi:hypothetical protein F2P81_004850 [Scophthalmus maximus]|uniref:Uncharacterized protein n=1 Tax=Scophthalmus maximus TaxID=52904 RepID=A0A6A4TBY7_SCOMX|nr:hypothetical protein F2P81_004850 [Scophthalmus maximus]